MADTRDIDFVEWQKEHSTREAYFFGTDNVSFKFKFYQFYCRNNQIFIPVHVYKSGHTKKFNELIKNKKVDEKSISLPIKPMYKVVYLNPQVTVGITGLRHIQKAGGLSTWPVIYMKKEHVSKNDSGKIVHF